MKVRLIIFLMLLADRAEALPRFAARTSMRCRQCHLSPTGGGVRNDYGRIFMQEWLPVQVAETDWISGEQDEVHIPFDGALTDWLAIGGDLRSVLNVREGDGVDLNSSFFLMQADLYHALTLGPYLTTVFDIGVNSGFEAWAMVKPMEHVLIRAGRFLPPVGLRFANHSLFTRERVGLGPGTQDTGLEVTLDARYVGATLAIMNGNFGERFDMIRLGDRLFDKAVAARGDLRLPLGPVNINLGGSFYFNSSIDRPNPLFTDFTPPTSSRLDEIRTGGFMTFNVGRITLIGDMMYVRDEVTRPSPTVRDGFALSTEFDLLLVQGLELLLGWEMADADFSVHQDQRYRVGAAVEIFPIRFLEVRLMVRHEFGPVLSDPITDAQAMVHVFL